MRESQLHLLPVVDRVSRSRRSIARTGCSRICSCSSRFRRSCSRASGCASRTRPYALSCGVPRVARHRRALHLLDRAVRCVVRAAHGAAGSMRCSAGRGTTTTASCTSPTARCSCCRPRSLPATGSLSPRGAWRFYPAGALHRVALGGLRADRVRGGDRLRRRPRAGLSRHPGRPMGFAEGLAARDERRSGLVARAPRAARTCLAQGGTRMGRYELSRNDLGRTPPEYQLAAATLRSISLLAEWRPSFCARSHSARLPPRPRR